MRFPELAAKLAALRAKTQMPVDATAYIVDAIAAV